MLAVSTRLDEQLNDLQTCQQGRIWRLFTGLRAPEMYDPGY